MQIDRQMLRHAMRLAPKLLVKGFPGLAGAPDATEGDAPGKPPLRGSGSWANEWAGRRAEAAARPAPKPGDAAPAPADPTLRLRPLMTSREAKLHGWILDRLEVEAPDCTLHAGVALSAFLAAEPKGALDGLAADMAIADETGRIRAALVRDRRDDGDRYLRLVDALLQAGVPTIELPDKLSLSRLWSEIAATLPETKDDEADDKAG